jgi:serine phosphatase RsbU (regulator of sigma subunit)
MAPAVFNYFFSVFPARSPIDRKFPWLKKVYLGVLGACSIPMGLACLMAGDLAPAYSVYGWPRPNLAGDLIYALAFSAYLLGFVSLVWNSVRPPTTEARRKTRVIVWGTLIGYGPVFLVYFYQRLGKMQPGMGLPWALSVISLSLMPVSYAYAVVRHRVLEIPVLFKRSARYLLVQRGFVVLTGLVTTAAILIFIAVLTRLFQGHSDTALRVGMGLGIAFGGVSAMINLHVFPRVTKRIDRAFFRSAYDARQIMESLAQKTRNAARREDLATLLEVEIREALHPASLVVYLEGDDGRLRTYANGTAPTLTTLTSGQGSGSGVSPRGGDDVASRVATRTDAGHHPPQSLAVDVPLLAELARRGGPWDVSASVSDGLAADRVLAPMRPECLVPVLGRAAQLTGLLALGPRLSEEPYSREDKRLLASVATQAAAALDNVRLAEGMAESMEAERRAAQEIDIARQVQARLFPQKHPPLKTLEYAGGCTQARQVGGDYYDFLDLGPGRLGLVLADIAGKGISGALLMANLQANLRSQYAVALEDLPRLLQSVNRLFYENTADNSYATLFFADYDDRTWRLQYANCGHLPALLLRAGGSVARLEATSTVLGLFESWSCSVEETFLAPGDSLVLYTDGVTEAEGADGEEFGEARLIHTVCAHRSLPVADQLTAIVDAVRQFSGPDQADDITLVVAKCHG